eukprot:gene15334-18139_t
MPPADLQLGLGATVVQVDVGEAHTCALLITGKLKCWGSNDMGQLGYGHFDDVGDNGGEMPPPDVDVGGEVVQTGAENGVNNFGDEEGEMPPAAVDFGGAVHQISAGNYHLCVLMTANRRVKCIGNNRYGQLGYGDTTNVGGFSEGDMPPAEVAIGFDGDPYEIKEYVANSDWTYPNATAVTDPLSRDVTQVFAGNYKTCAVLASGLVACWGSGEGFQLGSGHEMDIGGAAEHMPPKMIKAGGPVYQVDGGNYH